MSGEVVVAVIGGVVTLLATVITVALKRSTERGDGVHKLVDQLQEEVARLRTQVEAMDRREQADRDERDKLRDELDEARAELRAARLELTRAREENADLRVRLGREDI